MEIVVVGAGNLAYHFVQVLAAAGEEITLVSRQPSRVADWPVRVTALAELGVAPELVFLAVPDDAIHAASTELAAHLPSATPIVHTSGATPTVVINSHFARRGCLWPVRSLRLGQPVGDWRDLPLVYHAPDARLAGQLRTLCQRLSDRVYALDDAQRARLHLAAVFGNNFVTALYEISHRLCAEADIPFEALLPLIRETALRRDGDSPARGQTGAAARGDRTTMNRHLALLAAHPAYAELYRALSDIIQRGRPVPTAP